MGLIDQLALLSSALSIPFISVVFMVATLMKGYYSAIIVSSVMISIALLLPIYRTLKVFLIVFYSWCIILSIIKGKYDPLSVMGLIERVIIIPVPLILLGLVADYKGMLKESGILSAIYVIATLLTHRNILLRI